MTQPPLASGSHQNRLAGETSPYLQQHKHNPVDWWPWGPAALAEAKRLNRPILLSVGYAACHWCHVMAHESFEDAATAAVMNELFVNIKVDREERPDIDHIYMSALHLLGEQGGWPLTMFLNPDGEPVWGGTYFPKTAHFGRPAFVDVLREIARLFAQEPDKIDHNRSALMARLAAASRPAGQVTIGVAELDQAATAIARAFDRVNGGLQGAPKFPQGALLEAIWRGARRQPGTTLASAVVHTLDRICQGGIYDHLGGGFARYSVDERWLVPHFEKMLYDNAQLLELLALAWAETGDALFHTRARETVDWLAREMTTQDGAFCASLDADSEGEEGKFYLWTFDEIERVLGADDALIFAVHYDVSREGNFEGRTILNRLRRDSADEATETRLAAMRAKLLDARGARVRPGLDDKVLADWNGLMIAALVNAGLLFDEPDWIGMAERAFDFVSVAMTRNRLLSHEWRGPETPVRERLGHSWRDSKLLLPGLASDYAMMIRAALALFEATAEPRFLARARAWQDSLDRHHARAEGGYFLTADDAEALVLRPFVTTDDAMPNANAIAAQNLVRLALITGDERWRAAADNLFVRLLPQAADNLYAHLALLNALDLRLRAAELVVIGNGADELAAAALRQPFIDRIVTRARNPDDLPPGHPARAAFASTTTLPAALVCVGERCSLPVTDAAQLAGAIATMRT